MSAIKIIKRTVELGGNMASSSFPDPIPPYFFNDETDAHMFMIFARQNGQPFPFTTESISACFLNDIGTTVSITGSIVNGAACVTLSDACYQVSGSFTLTISVSGAVVYECRGTIKVRSSATAYDPTGEISVAGLSAEIAEMRTATAEANTATADANAAATAANLVAGSLKGVTDKIANEVYTFTAISVYATASGWRLNDSDGLCSSDSSYKLVKFKVSAGDTVEVVSTDRFQFQIVASVPSSGSSNRVGETYGAGTYILDVPTTAEYLIMSSGIADTPLAYRIRSNIDLQIERKAVSRRVIQNTDIEQGTWEANSKAQTDRRIRYNQRVSVRRNDVIQFVPNGLYIDAQVYESENAGASLLFDTGWTRDTSIIIPEEGSLILSFANGSSYGASTSISPNDYVADVRIVFNLDIISEMNQTLMISITKNDMESGTWENNRKASTSVRIRAKTRYVVHSGDLLICDANGLYYSFGIYSDEASTTPLYSKNWTNAKEQKIDYDGLLCFNVANSETYSSSTAITTDDYTMVCSIVSKSMAAVIEKDALEMPLNYHQKMRDFCSLIYGDKIASGHTAPVSFENFLWFSDPHTMYGNYSYDEGDRTYGCVYFDKYIDQMEYVYNSSPVDFALCDGDWNDGGLPDDELFKLSRANKMCKAKLAPFYNAVGNHDTNYQGRLTEQSEFGSTRFSYQCIKDLWYSDKDNCYYTFMGNHTKFYVLDSQIETSNIQEADGYLNTEIKWFANELSHDNSEHIVLTLHIYYANGNMDVHNLAYYMMEIAAAYNNRTAWTHPYENITYDFSGNTGKVELVFAGHLHRDFNAVYSNGNASIPIIGIINTGNPGGNGGYYGAPNALFDLVSINYDTRIVHCVRFGEVGEDRTVAF